MSIGNSVETRQIFLQCFRLADTLKGRSNNILYQLIDSQSTRPPLVTTRPSMASPLR